MLLVARLSLAFVLVVACVHATCSNPSFSYTELVPSAVTVTVNIMSGGTGCSEHYTMDGSTPDCSSTTTFNSTTNSTTPIVLYANTGSSQSQVMKAISCSTSGSPPSGIASLTVPVKRRLSVPTFSYPGGVLYGSDMVQADKAVRSSAINMAQNQGGTIRYTTNGANPTRNSTAGSSYTVTSNTSYTAAVGPFRAFATLSGWADSNVSASNPIRALQILPPPTFRSDADPITGSGGGSGARRLLISDSDGDGSGSGGRRMLILDSDADSGREDEEENFTVLNGEVRLNLTDNDVGEHGSTNRAEFERKYIADLAKSLNVDPEDIDITGMDLDSSEDGL